MFWYFLRRKLESVLILRDKTFLDKNKLTTNIFFRPRNEQSQDFVGGWSVSNPDSRKSMVWDLMQVFFLAYVSVSVPFQAGFEIDIDNFSFWWWVELVVDLYFLLDVIFNFRKPFTDPEGKIHMSSSAMALNYAKGWMAPDLCSCISLMQYVFMVTGDGESGDTAAKAKMAKTLRLMRLAKLLRLARLKRVFGRLPDAWVAFLQPLGNIFGLLVTTGFAMHLVSCFWHLAGITDAHEGWVEVVWPGTALGYKDPLIADSAAATVVLLSGLRCHATANAKYTIQPDLVNNRPAYAVEGVLNGWHLYWSPAWDGGVWIVDDDTEDEANAAYLGAKLSTPESFIQSTCGAHEWQEYCPGMDAERDWIQSPVTLNCNSAEFHAALQNVSAVGKKVKIPSLLQSYLKSLYSIMLADLPENPTVVEEGFALVSVIVNSFIYVCSPRVL